MIPEIPNINKDVTELFLDFINIRATPQREIANAKTHERAVMEFENSLRKAISECREREILQSIAERNDLIELSIETIKILFATLFELGGKNAENLKRLASHVSFLDTDRDARNPSEFVKDTLREYRRLNLKLPQNADVPEFEPIISEYEMGGKKYRRTQTSEISSYVEEI